MREDKLESTLKSLSQKEISESESFFLRMRLNFEEKEELIKCSKTCFKEQIDVLQPLVQELVALK